MEKRTVVKICLSSGSHLAYNDPGMEDLDRALETALDAHRGQKDRYGEPFILHPVRVMLRCALDDEKIVALLHDVVERGGRSLGDLKREGFADAIIAAVDHLTRRKGEPYLDAIARARENALARAVKQADLQDHMDAIHARMPGGDTVERLARYRRAMQALLADDRN